MHSASESSDEDQFSRGGLGSARAQISKPPAISQHQQPRPRASNASSESPLSSPAPSSPSSSSSYQDERTGVPSTFGGANARVRKRRRVAVDKPSRTPVSTATPAVAGDRGGEWERHTRGIASRILAKHGFTGRLGKRADGIAAPIQPVFRPEKLGLGAGGFSEKADDVEVAEAIEVRDRETAQGRHAQQHTRKDAEKGGRKGKRKHPPWGTTDDRDSFEKIIDMREALPREVKSAAALMEAEEIAIDMEKKKEQAEEDLFAAPELLYNLQMLSSNARGQVAKAKRRRETEKLIMHTAQREVDQANADRKEAADAVAHIAAMESLFDELTEAEKADDSPRFENTLKRAGIVAKIVQESKYVSNEVITAALTEMTRERVRQQLTKCLALSEEKGKADKMLTKHIGKVLNYARKAMNQIAYTRLCTQAILMPLRQHISRPAWDVVKGACIGDVLSSLRRIIPEVVVNVFAENVLVPRLVSRLLADKPGHNMVVGGVGIVPAHVWIHPWLPATGRRALVEVLHQVRVTLSQALQKWDPAGSIESRDALVEVVKAWSGTLSRGKLQLALSRHIAPKLGQVLRDAGHDKPPTAGTEHAAALIAAWAVEGVCSARLLARELTEPFLAGPCSCVRDIAFSKEGDAWTRAAEVYKWWAKRLPPRLGENMQGPLAATLFVIHASRVTLDTHTRHTLTTADLRPLLRNGFTRTLADSRRDPANSNDHKKADDARRNAPQRGRLVDVVELVGERAGVAVTREPDDQGRAVFRVGAARVTADLARGVLIVGSRVVDVDELVRLARGG